jgi:Tfp pilus assembly protein PilF
VPRPLIAYVVTAALAFTVYGVTLGFGFVWDDEFLIIDNRHLEDWSELPTNLTSDFFRKTRDTSYIGYWRPVVTLSYMADRFFFDDRPWGFHLRNVVLHMLASCLVLLVANRVSPRREVAFGAALLFAVHPVHVESVAWISGRTDLYCALFALLALGLDLEHSRKPRWFFRVGSVACTALALLAKEMGAVVPAMVFLRAWLLPGEDAERGSFKAAIRAAWPHALVLLAYVVVRFALLGIATEAPASAQAGRWVLFLTWWNGFVEYLRVLVWPSFLTVAPQIEQQHSVAALSVAVGIAALVMLLIAAWRIRRRVPGIAFAIGIFLLGLLPLTNFLVPINAPGGVPFTWAERFLYLPSVGFCIAASWFVLCALPGLARKRRPGRLESGKRSRPAPGSNAPPRWAVVLLALMVGTGAARAIARTMDWKDDLTLFASAAQGTPDSHLARLNHGVALADRGRLSEAEREYVAALELDPDFYRTHFDLGNLHRERGDLVTAEAAYRAALDQRPDHAQSHLNLGLTLLGGGRVRDALSEFVLADDLLPDYVDAKTNRANALRLLGRSTEAVQLYLDALSLEPSLAPARLGLAGAYLETGEDVEGVAVLQRLLRDEPEMAQAHLVLAIHLDRMGRVEEAEAAYREVLRLDPGNVRVRRRLESSE